MKLLTRTSLLYLLCSLPVLAGAGAGCYYVIEGQVRESTEEDLWKEKIRTEKLINKNDSLALTVNATDEFRKVEKISAKADSSYSLRDTSFYDPIEDEVLPFIVLRSNYVKGGQTYLITITKSMMESDDLMEGIYTAIVILFAGLLLLILLMNWIISKRLWRPFYKTIGLLQSVQLNEKNEVVFDRSKIREFGMLNESLNEMIVRIRSDFRRQKEFTENASHEMQTPVAVIQSKLDLLIQSKQLGGSEMEIINSIYESLQKLSRLNRTLLLLAKIENEQFTERSTVSMNAMIRKVLEIFDDRIRIKNIRVEMQTDEQLSLQSDPMLVEILITNLVHNAVRHNENGGTMLIRTTRNSLRIANPGAPLSIRPEELFQRFRKSSSSGESFGLGLAIVRTICDTMGWKVRYSYENGQHCFDIAF